MTEFQYDVPPPICFKFKDTYGVRDFPLNASKFYPNMVRAAPVYSCANKLNKNCKFVTRTVTENGVKGIRIWRIS